MRLKEKLQMAKTFKQPVSDIMLRLTELPASPSLKSGNKNQAPKEPIKFLALQRQFFKKEVRHDLMTNETEALLRTRQNEIVQKLRQLKDDLRQQEEEKEEKSTKKRRSKKSTKESLVVLNDSLAVLPCL